MDNITIYQFEEMFLNWEKDCGHDSTIRDKLNHPSFHTIVNMGEEWAPHIINLLRVKNSHIFNAMNKIFGKKIYIYQSELGRLDVICKKWVQWYENTYGITKSDIEESLYFAQKEMGKAYFDLSMSLISHNVTKEYITELTEKIRNYAIKINQINEWLKNF